MGALRIKAASVSEFDENDFYVMINPPEQDLCRVHRYPKKLLLPKLYRTFISRPEYNTMIYQNGEHTETFCGGTFKPVSIWEHEIVEIYNRDIDFCLGIPYPFKQEGEGERVSHTEFYINYVVRDPQRCYEEGLARLSQKYDLLAQMISKAVSFAKTNVCEIRNSLEKRIKEYFDSKGMGIKKMAFTNVVSPSKIMMDKRISNIKLIQGEFKETYAILCDERTNPANKLIALETLQILLNYALSGKEIDSATKEKMDKAREGIISQWTSPPPAVAFVRSVAESLENPEVANLLHVLAESIGGKKQSSINSSTDSSKIESGSKPEDAKFL